MPQEHVRAIKAHDRRAIMKIYVWLSAWPMSASPAVIINGQPNRSIDAWDQESTRRLGEALYRPDHLRSEYS